MVIQHRYLLTRLKKDYYLAKSCFYWEHLTTNVIGDSINPVQEMHRVTTGTNVVYSTNTTCSLYLGILKVIDTFGWRFWVWTMILQKCLPLMILYPNYKIHFFENIQLTSGKV